MTVWVYLNTRKAGGDKDRVKVFATFEAAEAWIEANDPEGVAYEHDLIGEASARGLSTSKQSAARAVELADQAIDNELPADADPEERATRKRKLLQGPGMFRESRKDRPQ